MKKLLLVFSILLCSSVTKAGSIILRVALKNGNENDYILADRPQISFEGNKVIFLCNEISTSYLTENIQNFVFLDGTETGVQEMKTGNTRFCYSEKGVVRVEGVIKMNGIKVFSINGQQYQPPMKYENNCVEIELSPLPYGCYIINIDKNQSVKIIRK